MAVLKGFINNGREVHKVNSIINGTVKVKAKLSLRLMKLKTNTSPPALMLIVEIKLFHLLLN